MILRIFQSGVRHGKGNEIYVLVKKLIVRHID